MKLPRDLSGENLVKLLSRFEYAVDRQTGSHIRLTTQVNGEHHVTIPAHDPLKIGTLNAILRDVAKHFGLTLILNTSLASLIFNPSSLMAWITF